MRPEGETATQVHGQLLVHALRYPMNPFRRDCMCCGQLMTLYANSSPTHGSLASLQSKATLALVSAVF
jgi:hypothetical protein